MEWLGDCENAIKINWNNLKIYSKYENFMIDS